MEVESCEGLEEPNTRAWNNCSLDFRIVIIVDAQ